MENPHTIFIGIAVCSIFLTSLVLMLQDSQSLASMLTVLLPFVLILSAVLFATRKFWVKTDSGGS